MDLDTKRADLARRRIERGLTSRADRHEAPALREAQRNRMPMPLLPPATTTRLPLKLICIEYFLLL